MWFITRVARFSSRATLVDVSSWAIGSFGRQSTREADNDSSERRFILSETIKDGDADESGRLGSDSISDLFGRSGRMMLTKVRSKSVFGFGHGISTRPNDIPRSEEEVYIQESGPLLPGVNRSLSFKHQA